MSNIIFVSNNVSHFSGATIAPSANALSFDSTKVPYSIFWTGYQTMFSPEFLPVAGTVTWFHCRFYTSSISYSGAGDFLRLMDTSGNLLFRCRKTGNSGQIAMDLYNDGSPVTDTAVPTVSNYTEHRLDVRLEIGLSSMAADMWINEVAAGSVTQPSNIGGYTNPTNFSLRSIMFSGVTGTYGMAVTEILMGDEDTRNARLHMLRPNSVGAYGEWTGLVGTLIDDDLETGMTTEIAEKRQSLVLNPYVGVPDIANVVTVSQTQAGVNAPGNIRHVLRRSAVNYDSPSFSVGVAPQFNLHDNPVNPATSGAWTETELNLTEAGFRSLA